MKKITFILLASFFLLNGTYADEGMWIPLFLKKYNIDDMQKKGFKLTAEDIYSVNNASLKDAVPIFGRGCTSMMVSEQGLLLTNHHCGYGQIQAHSSLDKDYLTNGFWAMSKEEELPNPGLSVTFLVRMEEVTDQVLSEVTDQISESQRQAIVARKSQEIILAATKGTHYQAKVKPFFSSNRYFLFVEEVFTDVRLVGAPPSAIGKFGGDTDNWMWPRHTGDFSVFRVYANKDNKPADYSQDNVPYKPKKHLKISMKGVEKGDFTMVLGYPGSTQEYLPSYAVDLVINQYNPHKIALRQTSIDIMLSEMTKDAGVRIKYSAKQAGVSNSWKKWIGESRGLIRLDAVNKKIAQETKFQKWADSDADLQIKYGSILPEYKAVYSEIGKYEHVMNYIFEDILSLELVRSARELNRLSDLNTEATPDELNKAKESVKAWANGFYKDYYQGIDQKIFVAFLKMYADNISKEYQPETFNLINSKYKGDYQKFADDVYAKSFMVSQEKFNAFIDKFSLKSLKKLEADPFRKLYTEIIDIYRNKLDEPFNKLEAKVELLDRKYMQGLIEMEKDKKFYPDANFTLRVSYGQVDDYMPRNAVKYMPFTTVAGIIEKDNPDIYDYRVPQKLKDLYQAKDYGKYGKDGELNVCFTASNHTTGGNSGSPVIDANGNLLGLNFDRNWEGTMSDIMYDPDQCRNITLDIRYALFLIDKYAGAGYLVEEMDLVY